MDRKLPANPQIQRLIRRSAAARCRLEVDATALRQRFDIPSRIRGSIKEHPSVWWLASLASGFAASWVFRRTPPTGKKHRGIPATLLGLTLTAARPLAKIWLGDQVKHWLAGPSFPSPARRPPPQPARFSKSL
jgi:hypothetical protein